MRLAEAVTCPVCPLEGGGGEAGARVPPSLTRARIAGDFAGAVVHLASGIKMVGDNVPLLNQILPQIQRAMPQEHFLSLLREADLIE